MRNGGSFWACAGAAASKTLQAAMIQNRAMVAFLFRQIDADGPNGGNRLVVSHTKLLGHKNLGAVVVQFSGADIPVSLNFRQTGMSAPPNFSNCITPRDDAGLDLMRIMKVKEEQASPKP